MSLEVALLVLLLVYVAHLRFKLWMDAKVIQSFQKSAIIVPKSEKKQDFGIPALLISALALLLALSAR
ncbi:MAG TPA: hypothetical protein VIK33_01935 [Anaerolineae bacterium]